MRCTTILVILYRISSFQHNSVIWTWKDNRNDCQKNKISHENRKKYDWSSVGLDFGNWEEGKIWALGLPTTEMDINEPVAKSMHQSFRHTAMSKAKVSQPAK
jgi:hypothetical protein